MVWALAFVMLLDRNAYGIAEYTARNILLLWSVADQVPTPIVTLSVPDFRALFVAPAGLLVPGSLLAVKCAALLIWLGGNIALFRWRTQNAATAESALPACGLTLISPLGIAAINSLSPAPFLVLCLVLGAWADQLYGQVRTRFGGWYFAQLFVCAALANLHPAGLAFPVWLAWRWLRQHRHPDEDQNIIPGRERTHLLIGIVFATVCGALLAQGWHERAVFHNPLTALATLIDLQPDAGAIALLPGVLGLILVIATIVVNRRSLRHDGLGAPLTLTWIMALPFADDTFAVLSLLLILYWGFASLMQVRLPLPGAFVAQRGLAFAVLLVACTGFLALDRGRFSAQHHPAELSAQDALIDDLSRRVQDESAALPAQPGMVSKTEKARRSIRVASQWPGRTMLACQCNVLPLPPALPDSTRFVANLQGIRYLIFDPRDQQNRALSQAFSVVGPEIVQTLSLDTGGALLAIQTKAPEDHAPADGFPLQPNSP
jgi:hypothetical protein